MKKRIYLDYASLTPMDHAVVREVAKYSACEYANPSSWYKEGVAAKKAMDIGRKSVAEFLHAHADEIVFTSGGTEANNIALMGVKSDIKGGHIIISEIEHSSIREVVAVLEKRGIEVTRIGVDEKGIVKLDDIKKAIKPNTFLISIMMVNNETGAVQPIRDIAKIIRQARAKFGVDGSVDARHPLFHTDASQAALYQDLNVTQLGVDMLTLDGSKVYGPRGIGALYVKRGLLSGGSDGVPIVEPIIYGGGQERGLRSGTENLPGIMGFAKALEIVGMNVAGGGRLIGAREKEAVRVGELKDFFVGELLKIRPDIIVNGMWGKSPALAPLIESDNNPATFYKSPKLNIYSEQIFSPHILNISIPGIDNEFLLFQLDAAGIACSTKSSCLRDEDESYVLKAMGANSKTSLRFSFGRWTKKGDIKNALKVIRSLISPKS